MLTVHTHKSALIPLDGDMNKVFIGPRNVVVHDVRGHKLNQCLCKVLRDLRRQSTVGIVRATDRINSGG